MEKLSVTGACLLFRGIRITLGKSSSILVILAPRVTVYWKREERKDPDGLNPAIYMIAVSSAADDFAHGQAYKALYATILGPIFLTLLLLFVSGIPLSERPKAKARYESDNNWQAYKRWLDRTSILIPFPPQLYEKMPTILKRTIFLEFPMYIFDQKKHSDMSQPGRAADEGDVGPGGNDQSSPRQSGEERLIY